MADRFKYVTYKSYMIAIEFTINKRYEIDVDKDYVKSTWNDIMNDWKVMHDASGTK